MARILLPARRAGRPVLLVFAVLVGLFLMHGISASGDTGCAAPTTQFAMNEAGQSAAPARADAGASTAPGLAPTRSSARDCGCDHPMLSCTPLTGRDTGALLDALLLALATLLGPLRLAAPVRFAVRVRRERRRWAVPGVLDLACVSRT